ncbi:MAG: ABC transporter ATP-binding protein [Actinomycetota bacterium]|nr:ABC transporter ATP-binding protein [Actinomycetota bacterium]
MDLPPPGPVDAPAAAPVDADAVVVAQQLVKRFGQKTAVDGITLAIPHGSFYGLVGPNGAGKTTTIRMMVGLLRPDQGNVSVLGRWVWPQPAPIKNDIGVLPDDLRLFERLTGRELLTYLGLLRGLERAVVDNRTDDLLETLGLTADGNTLVADYSTGMRKKVALAAAILHAPKVLFLDEPFESVDPISSRTITEVLQGFRERGGTVVFSSHVMDTVERLCDHVAIIANGRIARSGTIAEVCNGKRLDDAFVDAVGSPASAGGSLDWLHQ